jgi:hypothetical protein
MTFEFVPLLVTHGLRLPEPPKVEGALRDVRREGAKRRAIPSFLSCLPQLPVWHGACSLFFRHQMNDVERSRMAREKMDRGELPRVNPQRIWVHAGTWERCALCGVTILESEMEYELQFTLRLVSYWFHAACYATWLDEWTKPRRSS